MGQAFDLWAAAQLNVIRLRLVYTEIVLLTGFSERSRYEVQQAGTLVRLFMGGNHDDARDDGERYPGAAG